MNPVAANLLGKLFTRQALMYWLITAGLLVIMLVHLGTQPSGLSPDELASANHSQFFHSIVKNPINAPHDLLSFGLDQLGHSPFILRLGAAVWGIIMVLSFLSLSKVWFGKIIGLIGAVFIATTPLFLIASRQASADIMLASPILIMAAYAWLLRPKTNKAAAVPVIIVLSAVLVYVPGMIWWLAVSAVVSRQKIFEIIKTIPKPRLYLGLLGGLLIIVPMIAAIAYDWRLIKTLALIPNHFSPVLTEFKNIGWMFSAWFVKTPFHSQLLIGRLPILDVIQDAMIVFGAYALLQAAKKKAWILIAAMAFATLAAGLNDNIRLLLLGLPAAGLIITAGLRFLYVEWRGVFPRNPAAKYLAILLIVLLGTIHLLFGVRYALTAWPHTVATRDSYVLR